MDKKKLTEHLRNKISDHLTNVLLLLGRLDSSHNPGSLPATLRKLLLYITRLELLEKTHEDFASEFSRNVFTRENYSQVFLIPETFKQNPTVTGLRSTILELVDGRIKEYCLERERFLSGELASNRPSREKYFHLVSLMEDCRFLHEFCSEKNCTLLEKLKKDCESGLQTLE